MEKSRMKSVLENLSVEGCIIDEKEVFCGKPKKRINSKITNQNIIPLSPDKTIICTLYNIFFEKIQIEENELTQLNKDEVYIFGPSGSGKTRKLLQYALSLNSSYLIYVCFPGHIPNSYNNKDLAVERLLKIISDYSLSKDICNETKVFYLSRFIHLIKMKKKYGNLSSKQFLVSQFGAKNQNIIDEIYYQIRKTIFNGNFKKNFEDLEQYIQNNKYFITKKNVKIGFDEISSIFQFIDPKFAKPVIGGYIENEKRPLPYPFFHPAISIFGGKLFCGTIARIHWRDNIISIAGKETKEAIGNVFINKIGTVETIKQFVQKFVTKSINWEKVKKKEKLFGRFRLIERFVCSLLTSDYSIGPIEPFIDKIIVQVFNNYLNDISTTIKNSCKNNPNVRLLLMLIQTKLRGNDYKHFKVVLSNDLDIMPAQVAYLCSNGKYKKWELREELAIEALKFFNFETIGNGIIIESLKDELKYIATALEGRHKERGFDFEQFFSMLFFNYCKFKNFEQIFGDLSKFKYKGDFPNQKLMKEILFKGLYNYYIHSIIYTNQTRNKINSLHQTNKIDLLTIFGKKENNSVLSMSLKTSKNKVCLNERKSAVKQSSLCYPFLNNKDRREEYIKFINKLNLKNIVRLIIEVNGKYSIPNLENYHFFTKNNMDDANRFENIENIKETIIWVDETNIGKLIGEDKVFYLSFMADIRLNASNYSNLSKLIFQKKKDVYYTIHALNDKELKDEPDETSFYSFQIAMNNDNDNDVIMKEITQEVNERGIFFKKTIKDDIIIFNNNGIEIKSNLQNQKELFIFPKVLNYLKIQNFIKKEINRRKRKRIETKEEEIRIRKESSGKKIKKRKIDYESFTKQQVKDWINSIDKSDEWKKKNYGQLFFENGFDGTTIKTITKEDLKELKIKMMAERNKIFKEIQDL